MTRLAALLWVMGGTVLAGLAVLGVLMTPGLTDEALRYIPIAAVAGYVVGIPLALMAAKAITRGTAVRRRMAQAAACCCAE
ncbi:hypothetical protein [Rhodoblastus sp.]|uniref:hypothetical protein n=1 Tax=Rhodoblastus sp. TaxID=1962975 RepID=UPI003F9B1096